MDEKVGMALAFLRWVGYNMRGEEAPLVCSPAVTPTSSSRGRARRGSLLDWIVALVFRWDKCGRWVDARLWAFIRSFPTCASCRYVPVQVCTSDIEQSSKANRRRR